MTSLAALLLCASATGWAQEPTAPSPDPVSAQLPDELPAQLPDDLPVPPLAMPAVPPPADVPPPVEVGVDTASDEPTAYLPRKRFAISAALGQTWSRRASRVIDDEQIYFLYEPHTRWDAALSFCVDCSRDSKLPLITLRYTYFRSTVEPWTRDFEVGALTAHTVSLSPLTFIHDVADTNGRVLQHVELFALSLSFGQVDSEGGWFYAPGLSGTPYEVLPGGTVKPSVGFALLQYGVYLKLLPATYIGVHTVLYYQSVMTWDFAAQGDPSFTEQIHPIDHFLPVFVEAKIAL